MQRNDEETIKAYKIRLCKNKELYELTWPNIVDLLADEGETIAERSLRGWWTAYLEGITDSELSNSDDNYLKECELKKQEWQKEKMKAPNSPAIYFSSFRYYAYKLICIIIDSSEDVNRSANFLWNHLHLISGIIFEIGHC